MKNTTTYNRNNGKYSVEFTNTSAGRYADDNYSFFALTSETLEQLAAKIKNSSRWNNDLSIVIEGNSLFISQDVEAGLWLVKITRNF